MSQSLDGISIPLLRTPDLETASSSDIGDSDVKDIFDTAFKLYKEKSKINLKDHDLFKRLDKRHGYDSPAAIIAKFLATQLDSSQTKKKVWFKAKRWLIPVLNVLCALSFLYLFSNTFDNMVSSIESFPYFNPIIAGIGSLFLAAKGVIESQDEYIRVVKCIGGFFVRLEIYTKVPLTPEMTDKMVQLTVDILDILATITIEMTESRTTKVLKKAVGGLDNEDWVKKLDVLTNEEVAIATWQNLKVSYHI